MDKTQSGEITITVKCSCGSDNIVVDRHSVTGNIYFKCLRCNAVKGIL